MKGFNNEMYCHHYGMKRLMCLMFENVLRIGDLYCHFRIPLDSKLLVIKPENEINYFRLDDSDMSNDSRMMNYGVNDGNKRHYIEYITSKWDNIYVP